MGPFLGQAVDALLGRSSLRYQFEITPQFVADLPSGVTVVSLLWEKGSKVSYTDPADVSPQDHTAAFAQVMRQTASIYKHGNTLLPKYYTFKVQSVQSANPSSCSSTVSTPGTAQSADISGRCKTIARARLDLAQFCNAESAGPGPATEVQVPLEPQGILHLSIKTVWLQHYDRSQPRQLQLQVQGSERSAAQLWGGSSDVATTHTDKSSVTSSIVGSYHGDEDRAACSGSAELDRLLLEAEAATVAKTVPTGAGNNAASNRLTYKPRVVTLDTLSTATAGAVVPRGPSKQHYKTPNAAFTSSMFSQQAAQQHGLAGQSVLDILDAVNSQLGGASRQASPFGGLTYNSLYSSRSSWEGRADSPFGDSRRWRRRASSIPETPPILEEDREGLQAGSFPGAKPVLTSSAEAYQYTQSQEPAGGAQGLPVKGLFGVAALPFGIKASSGASTEGSYRGDSDDEDDAAVWMDACSSGTSAAMQGCAAQVKGAAAGPEGLRSLSGRMPTWLWPSSRLAVRDLTTDQIMRRISGSRDAAALQHMCRGLLCERNDWRFRATQAERINASLQQELHQLRTSESEAQQQLQQQLSEGQLVHKLVDAKLQLAQADLSMQDLKRQLERERQRHLQALARLTSLQANFDQYIHEHQAAGLDCCKPICCYV